MYFGLAWILLGFIFVQGMEPQPASYPNRYMNLRVSPVPTPYSPVGATIDIGAGAGGRLTLGPSLLAYKRGQQSEFGQAGFVASYFLTDARFRSSLIVRSGIFFLPFSPDSINELLNGSGGSLTWNISGGYHWPIKESRLNLSLVGGLTMYESANIWHKVPEIDLSLGWLF
jgi:hypothetical protein